MLLVPRDTTLTNNGKNDNSNGVITTQNKYAYTTFCNSK